MIETPNEKTVPVEIDRDTIDDQGGLSTFATGAKPDEKDRRDYIAKAGFFRPRLPKTLIQRSSLKHLIMDQGSEGSCVAHALAFAYSIQVKGAQLSKRDIMAMAQGVDSWERTSPEGTDGTSLRDALKAVNKIGAAYEEQLPYVANDRAGDMSFEKYSSIQATKLKNRIFGYERVPIKHNLIKRGIFSAGCVMATIALKREFTKDSVNVRQQGGYHAVCITGYTDKSYEIANSWGHGWGIDGFTYVSYDYILKNAVDLWTMVT